MYCNFRSLLQQLFCTICSLTKKYPLPENEIAAHVNDDIVYNGNANDGRETRQNLALRLRRF